MKRALRTTVYNVLSQDGLCNLWRTRSFKDRIIFLMYHEVLRDEQDIEAWTVVRQSAFIRQMEYLKHAFEIVSMRDVLEYHRSMTRTQKPYAVVTFDDGYAGNLHTVLPIVEALGIPITIFVATRAVLDQKLYWFDEVILALQGISPSSAECESLVEKIGGPLHPDNLSGEARWNMIEGVLQVLKKLEPDARAERIETLLQKTGLVQGHRSYLRPMTVDEVTKIASSPLVTIGAHSHCHNILPQLSKPELGESIQISKSHLEAWTGHGISYFAYPNGDYNVDVMRAVKDAGFTCAFSTEPILWQRGHAPFAIPRIGIGRYDTLAQFKVRVSGFLI